MTRDLTIAGLSPTRRRLATIVMLVGLGVVGSHLARVWPRDVDVIYQANADIRRVDVEVLQGGEVVTSARFTRPPGSAGPVFHTISLQPGEYRAHITVYGPDGRGTEHSQLLTVPVDRAIRFDLRD